MSAVDAQHWVRDVMEKTYPLGVFCDRTKEAHPRPSARSGAAARRDSARFLASPMRTICPQATLSQAIRKPSTFTCAWPALAARAFCCWAKCWPRPGLDAGLEVSWLPSYGPEMRSGTSNCHVRLSNQTIDSPLVTAPNILVAMNEPSLRKFDKSVRPGGWVIYNGEDLPARLRARRCACAGASVYAGCP